jgi:hypothetical protein
LHVQLWNSIHIRVIWKVYTEEEIEGKFAQTKIAMTQGAKGSSSEPPKASSDNIAQSNKKLPHGSL